MNIFEFDDYKEYTKKRFELLPKKGHGQLKKLAEYMTVHTTFVSQVFNGNKSLNPEQGVAVADFLGLTEIEKFYYIKLIQIDRAGTEKYKNILIKEADKIKQNALQVNNRLQIKKILTEEQTAVFYSSWYYSAIRLVSDISGYNSIEAIAEYFNLPRRLVADVISFLLENELLIERNGKIMLGPSKTHLNPDSPFRKLHHLNWRNKALESISLKNPESLHYSSPMTVSRKDVEKVKGTLVKIIEDIGIIVDQAKSEELMCLNIDWFNIK